MYAVLAPAGAGGHPVTGLNGREQRALRAIERALTLDDPALAGILATQIPAEPTVDASITDAPDNAPVSAASVGAAPADVGARFVRRLADGFVVVVVALILAGLVLPDNCMIVGGLFGVVDDADHRVPGQCCAAAWGSIGGRAMRRYLNRRQPRVLGALWQQLLDQDPELAEQLSRHPVPTRQVWAARVGSAMLVLGVVLASGFLFMASGVGTLGAVVLLTWWMPVRIVAPEKPRPDPTQLPPLPPPLGRGPDRQRGSRGQPDAHIR